MNDHYFVLYVCAFLSLFFFLFFSFFSRSFPLCLGLSFLLHHLNGMMFDICQVARMIISFIFFSLSLSSFTSHSVQFITTVLLCLPHSCHFYRAIVRYGFFFFVRLFRIFFLSLSLSLIYTIFLITQLYNRMVSFIISPTRALRV